MISICMRCGRVLKAKPWVQLGIGRVCAAYMGITPDNNDAESKKTGCSAGAVTGIGTFDVILERDNHGSATANVPHAIVRHSPDGFEWGYGGSGPAELALNVLSSMIGQEQAQENGLYQQFKWDFIAHMPPEGGYIREEEISKWLGERGIRTKK